MLSNDRVVRALPNTIVILTSSGKFSGAWSRSEQPTKLATVALFPAKSFLENLALRSNDSVLVTSMSARERFYVPPSDGAASVDLVSLHTFDQPTTGVVEVDPWPPSCEHSMAVQPCARPRLRARRGKYDGDGPLGLGSRRDFGRVSSLDGAITAFVACDLSLPQDEQLAMPRHVLCVEPRCTATAAGIPMLRMQHKAAKAAGQPAYRMFGTMPMAEMLGALDSLKPRVFWSELGDPLGDRITSKRRRVARAVPEQAGRVAAVRPASERRLR